MSVFTGRKTAGEHEIRARWRTEKQLTARQGVRNIPFFRKLFSRAAVVNNVLRFSARGELLAPCP
jgi:hypothetical protein